MLLHIRCVCVLCFQTSLEPFLSSLADSSCLVDGKMADGDALLSGDEEKPGKAAGRTFAVDLLYDTVLANSETNTNIQLLRLHERKLTEDLSQFYVTS